MRKKVIGLIIVIVCIAFCISGCQPQPVEDDPDSSGGPRTPLPHLAYKGDKLVYDINDVTLTFYCGSEYAGNPSENTPVTTLTSYSDYPTVTYIYFANDNVYTPKYVSNNPESGFLIGGNEISFGFVEGFTPQTWYETIETNENFSICKKFLSSDEDAFYKNNTVALKKHTDKPFVEDRFEEEALWGKGSALYKVLPSYMSGGLLIPDISYDFTIPKDMFTEDTGYLFFGLASYYAEDFEISSGQIAPVGHLLEHRVITIYYTKEGTNITLSSYYEGENKK